MSQKPPDNLTPADSQASAESPPADTPRSVDLEEQPMPPLPPVMAAADSAEGSLADGSRLEGRSPADDPGAMGWWAVGMHWGRKLWPWLHLLGVTSSLLFFVLVAWRQRLHPIVQVVGNWRTPLYLPWLYLLLAASALGLAGALLPVALRFRKARTTEKAGSVTEPSPPDGRLTPEGRSRPFWDAPAETPLSKGDGLLVLALLGISSLLILAFRLARNPAGVAAGSDYVTFLGNIVAAGLSRWELYNPDKRLPYPWLAARVSQLSGLSFLQAGLLLSQGAVSLLAPLTWLMGRPVVGRLAALLAALLVLCTPVLHPFAIYANSYGLFFLTVALGLTAATWAVSRGHLALYLAFGLAAVACAEVQEKGMLIMGLVSLPLAWAALRAPVEAAPGTNRRGHWKGRLARLTCLLLLPLSPMLHGLYPVQYPSLGAMVAINREEVHRDMPFEWPQVRQPDADRPFPGAGLLPERLKGSDLEAFLAVTLAPPDQDVLLIRRARANGRTVRLTEVRPHTTLPPLERRLSGNLRVLADRFPGVSLPAAQLLLLGMLSGLLGFVATRPSPAHPSPAHPSPAPAGADVPLMSPSRLSASRRLAYVVLLAALLSTLGSLSLNFHTRYFLPALPVVALGVVQGARALLALLIPGEGALVREGWLGRRGRRWARNGLWLWFCLSLCVSLFTARGTWWLAWGLPVTRLPPFLGVADRESHVGRGLAVARVADWLQQHLPAQATVLDCSPLAVWLSFPNDARFPIPPGGGPGRGRACQAVVGGAEGPRADYVIVSDLNEFRGDFTLTPASVEASGRVASVFGVVLDTLEPFTSSRPVGVSSPVLQVFRLKPADRVLK